MKVTQGIRMNTYVGMGVWGLVGGRAGVMGSIFYIDNKNRSKSYSKL